MANLKLGRYDHALEDAGELTASYQKSEKGFYRAARSLYELGRFQECHNVLKLLLEEYPHCAEARNELSRTEHRLREQEHGDFNFKTMYEAAKKNPPRLDCATYIGPVSIKASEGRGRGLFTKKDVLAGELLLCEKAFAYCWADSAEGNASSKTSLLINMHTNRAFMGTQADMITDIVQKMYRNPSLMPAFTSLHHGDYKPVEQSIVDGVPVVDTSVTPLLPKLYLMLMDRADSWSIVPYHTMSSAALERPSNLTSRYLNRRRRIKAITPVVCSSTRHTSTTAATAMLGGALLATCRLCERPATSRPAQR